MIEKKQIDKWLVYYPSGRLDVKSAKILEEDLVESLNSGIKNVIFNMGHVEYMSSSGIRVLIYVLRRLNQAGGELRLCNINEAVYNIIRIVDLEDIFSTFVTEEEALG